MKQNNTQAQVRFQRHTVTSALPYANGPIHIGHLAGVYVPADIYARYLRLKGEDVVFIGGSDEHGVPITIKAKQEGVTPQQVVDKYHKQIKESFEAFGISFDVYSRTSDQRHHDTASDFFRKLYDTHHFVEQESDQYFDEEQKQFLADRYITGTCPHCGFERAYGDQCENCGTSLNATDLINPKSVLSGNPPVLKLTKHWFLPLNDFEPMLRQWILKDHKHDWKTNVYGQCKSWIDQGLQPRAVTRDLDWGVKVPIEGAEGKVLYVWFDAPIGYISATREWAEAKGKDWEPYWKSNDTRLVHFIGKDNIVFHCIVFPAMLKAEGSYILPDNVPANEFLNLEGDKVSTSRNWAVWLHEYLQDFPGKQDVLRYALCAAAPETKDNDFTWKDFQARNNSELVAILGNFVNRTLVLVHKYFNGCVPEVSQFMPEDLAVVDALKTFPGKISISLDNFRFREALAEYMNLARLGNKYLTDAEPWKIFQTDPDRVATILNISLQLCANLAILGEPFLPFSSQKLFAQLNLEGNLWHMAGNIHILNSTQVVNAPQLLFEKIEDHQIAFQVEKLAKTKLLNQIVQTPVEAAKDPVSFEEFQKTDLRIGTILTAEKIAKTKKLLKLEVDTGVDRRTIVSGIAGHFAPEQLPGKKVVVLLNLEPRVIKGVVSHGMLLLAETPQGGLHFIVPEGDVDNGMKIS